MKYIDVVVAVIENSNREILIAQRQQHQHLAGCWEFPGGKVDRGENLQQALMRELKEELALDAHTATPLFDLTHDYPEKSVHLHFFSVTEFSGVAQGCEGQSLCWVTRDQLGEFQFPEANKALLDYLNKK